MDRGNGLETRPRIEYQKRGDVILNLPALAGILASHGGEEVRNIYHKRLYLGSLLTWV
jgi:hypothetical protein